MLAYDLRSIDKIAEALGGEVTNGQVLAPGPGHSAKDRSLSVKLDSNAPDGFVVHSFAKDDPLECRDHVRKRLGLPEFEPKKKASGSSSKNKKGNGAAKPWSPIIARYVYRLADGTPYLQVCRTAAKQFFQNKWNGQMWVTGKPDGPKIAYRLPELRAAPLTTQVHIAEGEQDADALATLGFVATTNSEGAGNWTDDLNEYFRDRHVCIHEDNDEQGRKRVQRIARALHSIAASTRVIRLPGLKEHGDISDWLESDPSGARLVKECESTPVWEPSTTPLPEKEKEETDPLVEPKKKQADVLIELASSVELFHDRDDVGYARFDVNGHKENWPIRSKGFKRWLTRGFYESTQSAPSSEAMQAALGVLEARAQFDAPGHEVHVRVAGHDECIYIDLADRDWRAIEIDQSGWRIVNNPPVYFRRSSGMKPLPEPVTGGSLNHDLRPLLNVKTDHEFVLNVAWLLAALRPCGPYPIEALTGELGSAKSMRSNFLRALIDPNSVPLRAPPRSEHDVFIAARNGHVLAYDNASGLPDWLSDTLCRLATGGGFSTRELYTDQDEVLFGSKRPIILNGIDDIATRPDLADRCIVQTPPAISENKRELETELWAKFEQKRPRILGALLTAVSHGLKTLPDVKLDRKPRMADFAQWVTACEGALWAKGTFMAAYTGNIEEAIETVLENDQVAAVLRTYIDMEPDGFTGTAADFLNALNAVASETQQNTRGWPKSPAVLAKTLRRIAPPLRKIGIDVAFERENRQRRISIAPVKVGETPSQPSPPSFSSSLNDLERTACCRRAVTGEEATVASDGSDSNGDGDDRANVTANPLKNKDGDGSDGSDGIFPNLTGRHVCAQCHGVPDGKERFVAYGDETIWLHAECERFFIQVKMQEQGIPW
jgi:Toprim-like